MQTKTMKAKAQSIQVITVSLVLSLPRDKHSEKLNISTFCCFQALRTIIYMHRSSLQKKSPPAYKIGEICFGFVQPKE